MNLKTLVCCSHCRLWSVISLLTLLWPCESIASFRFVIYFPFIFSYQSKLVGGGGVSLILILFNWQKQKLALSYYFSKLFRYKYQNEIWSVCMLYHNGAKWPNLSIQFNSIYFSQIILWCMRCYIQYVQIYTIYVVHVSYDRLWRTYFFIYYRYKNA